MTDTGQHQRITLQPDGSMKAEPLFDPIHVANTVVHIANLPTDVQVLNITIMSVDFPMSREYRVMAHILSRA